MNTRISKLATSETMNRTQQDRVGEVRAAIAAWAADRAQFAWWVTASRLGRAQDDYVRRAMECFVERVAARAGGQVPYVYVVEHGDAFGHPHGHILLGGAPGLTRSYLERILGRGWDVHVEPYRPSGGAEVYVTKQLAYDHFEWSFWFPEPQPAEPMRPRRQQRGGRDRRHPRRRR